MPCVGHKFLEDVHEDSMQFPSKNNRVLCNCPDGPLKVSRRPAVSRSFSVVAVRTIELHRPNTKSSYSEFNTELNFRIHYLGRSYQTSRQRGNTFRRYPMFQNILGLLYGWGNEWQHWLSRHSVKPSGRGPVLGRIALFWKSGCRRLSGPAKWPSGRYSPESEFEQY